MDFTTNYCGPYWSAGKFQSSVDKGPPGVSPLDEACRRHDAAYKNHKTRKDLIVADNKFYTETRDLGFRGPLYGAAVLYGNRAIRWFDRSNTGSNIMRGAAAREAAGEMLASTRVGFAPTVQEFVYDPYTSGRVTGATTREPARNKPYTLTPVEEINLKAQLPSQETKDNFVSNFTPLYRPLRKKAVRPPRNKNIRFVIPSFSPKKNKVKPHGQSNSPAHVDQASCKHEELRRCFNYQYCPRCNREFHHRK